MKRNCKRWLISGMFFLLMCCLPGAIAAQTTPPPPDPCDQPHEPDNPPCPVDGGLSLLLAAGMVYGAKKVKRNRNKKTVPLI
ncbi:MAG: hypothetical protein ABIU77_16200 [Ferruginibacter sp.]